ncbi:MAG: S8 family serine peptidase [Rikenellaceae bacterium]|jgi:subtilisin family serine protease|nr:S8 family serine peptidase [Rikenellaceae bacterium]
MRRTLLYLAFLLALGGCSKESLPTSVNSGDVSAGEPSIEQGVLRIKLSDGAGELDTGSFTRGGSSGIASFDATATRLGATALARSVEDAGRFRARHRRAGLHRWYEVALGEDVSVEEAVAQFKATDGIAIAEPVYRMIPAGEVSGVSSQYAYASRFDDPMLGNQWILHNDGSLRSSVAGADLNVFPAWESVVGDPAVIVAVVDGGIQWNHPDLAANMWYDPSHDAYGYNFCRRNYEITPSNHGTHVAGTIGAVNGNGIGVCGIAGGDGTAGSGVKLMSCQVFDEHGRADIMEIMTWSADNGAVISQNSWSYVDLPELSTYGKEAIDYFIENAGRDEAGNQIGPMAGGIVIFAAGNSNTSTPTYPAAYDKVLAVGSIGPNFVKSPESNFGEWVNLVATGGNGEMGEKYRTFSTSTGDGYAYASGTSMACPQVSGIAALAVAKYGTAAPGFTNDMLWELLTGSGRREVVEQYNRGYEGMLGAGLVDAEYVIYRDEAPRPVSDLVAAPRRYGVTLEWRVPESWAGQPASAFEIFVSTEPLSGNYEQFAAKATKYHIENSFGGVGAAAEYSVGNLATESDYWFAVVAVSKFGTTSEPVFIDSATGANSAPRVVKEFPNIYLAQIGGTATLDLSEYFADADAPTDRLTYFVSYSTGGIVECRLEEQKLLFTALAKGSATLTVIARDRDGATGSAELKVVVEATGNGGMDLYPNPVGETLYVRRAGATGDFAVKIYDRAGQKVADTTVAIEDGGVGSLDVGTLAPGGYTFVLNYHGQELKKNIVKR